MATKRAQDSAFSSFFCLQNPNFPFPIVSEFANCGVFMDGIVESDEISMHLNGKLSISAYDFDPTAVVAEPLPAVVKDGEIEGEEKRKRRGIVLGRNVHTSCLAVSEPDANDEFTGEKEAYMAAVLAKYRRILLERTKHHLGKL